MQNVKRPGRPARSKQQRSDESMSAPVSEGVEPSDATDAEFDAYDTFEMYRVTCPDCAQPIALLADEDVLPEHALCATRWNPFGLTVCPGTGRSAAEAEPADETMEAQEQDTALLLTLPQGLDWRTQPFSHVAGPRPRRAPEQDGRSAA
ncbi:hypothetical protein [Streptomyces sp. NPDC058644]|uniref:hypothetical protein n=1 Tax=unclassified Streptomyces TaxID=2593676 RepID=UPI0036522372